MDKIKIKRFPLTEGEYEKVFSIVDLSQANRSKTLDKKILSVKSKKDYEVRIRFERSWKRVFLFLVFSQEDREQLLSIGRFGEGRTFDDSPLPLDDYNVFCQIFQDEVIPIIIDRLYDLFGIKKEYLDLEFLSKDELLRSVEVV